jgi:hypothetical protein
MAFGGSNSSCARPASRRAALRDDLRRLDAQLDELRRESDQLEATIAYLDRRRSLVETQWIDLLEMRDVLESQLWDRGDASFDETPRPPRIEDGPPASKRPDPVLEPWDIDELLAPQPQWIPPARTWEIAIAVPTGLPLRRVPPEPAPTRVNPVDTAPLWHRTPRKTRTGQRFQGRE